MKKTKLVDAFNEWQKAVEEVDLAAIDPIPEGWLRSDATGLSTKQLRKLVENKRAEVKKFRVYCPSRGGGSYPIPHYRLKK